MLGSAIAGRVGLAQTCNANFDCALQLSTPMFFLCSSGDQNPCLTVVVLWVTRVSLRKCHLIPSNGFSGCTNSDSAKSTGR